MEFDTATLSLGRHTPRTAKQCAAALAGIAQCDTDWSAKGLTTSDDMISQGRDAYWKSGYRLRWLEHVPSLPKAPVSA
jgi:hypothetical protein